MNVPVVADVVTPAAVLGARRRDNGGWFWNPNGDASLPCVPQIGRAVGAAELEKRPVGRCFLPARCKT